ncbi:MAG: pilus assembly protein N-terminal domain-containing protein [Methylacidiphilales bacterium]|nr:pilus assembly protein N-terminal domain-containing protein [Candidatus Methylacidiphilales bacterium]
MKHLLPLHPPPNRLVLFAVCLLALSCGLLRAQAPVATELDVYFGDVKLLPIDHPIDSFTVTPDNIVKVEKSDASPNQLAITGIAEGTATLTVKSNGVSLVYAIAVSPAPQRLYINLNESKRLSFPDPIDDTSLSQQGIIRVVQPDSTDKVLLVEATTAGKTTLTVYSKGEIYRYFISTFENRGADVLEIQNAFSAKGYRNLTITFDKDQAIIGGTVPTQEELDDAVRIVKQFTDYVVVKAQLGQEVEESEYTQQELIIINNIQRIANVKGLTIRVKFPMPHVVTTSTTTKSTGDYIEPTTTTTPQGGTIRGSGFLPPANQQQGPNVGGPLEPKPQQNVTETVTTSENTSIPEKIFLYGDLQDDLEEAKVIRVARTFCPFIVNFLTVKDPIQVRVQLRFMQITRDSARDTGILWSGGGPNGAPAVAMGFGGSAASGGVGLTPITSVQDFINLFTKGVSAGVDAAAELQLYENLGLTKEIQESEIFLTNGQPGWYSEGEVKYYINSSTITASSPPLITVTASPIFLGVNMDISPLNLISAGGTEPTGQKIYGIPGTISTGTTSYTLEQNSDPTADKVSQIGAAIQQGGGTPVVDNTVKYVDENGLIGLNISTQLTVPNGPFQQVNFGTEGQFVTLPDFFVRTTRTRANVRDGQSVAITGLINEETARTITSVPFLSKIPLFSALFKAPDDTLNREEVIVLVTPHIVRMRDPDSSRYPKPVYPEMLDAAREAGDVPIIKPVRYDAEAVDIRPEQPKDMKDAAVSDAAPSSSAPLAPHASGGMQTLQPASEPAPMPPAPVVDKPAPARDISRQPSSAPLAPSSTLP